MHGLTNQPGILSTFNDRLTLSITTVFLRTEEVGLTMNCRVTQRKNVTFNYN